MSSGVDVMVRLAVVAVVLSGLNVGQSPAAKLGDAGWLVGAWKQADAKDGTLEEVWSTPAGGAMVGTFRWLRDGKPVVYEFMLLEESADGVTLRVRHYRPQMVDLDKEPIRLKMTQAN